MKKILQLLFIGLLGFSMVGCHGCKEPVEDPCEGVEEVAADFTMMENGYPYTLPPGSPLDTLFKPFDTDTVRLTRVVFTAKEEDAEYTWIIGSETLHTRVVERSGFPKGETIPITLIVKKAPNKLCFPNDDGVDTLVRYLHILPESPPRAFGYFQGHLEGSPQDTFTVSFLRKEIVPGSYDNKVYNLQNDGCETIFKAVKGFRQLAFYVNTIGCDGPAGVAEISPDDSDEITITYWLYYGENKGQRFIFKGQRK